MSGAEIRFVILASMLLSALITLSNEFYFHLSGKIIMVLSIGLGFVIGGYMAIKRSQKGE